MEKELKKNYWRLLIPALVFLFSAEILKKYQILTVYRFSFLHALEIVLFILSAAFSLVLPVLYRIWFVNRVKEQKSLSADEFLRYEKNMLTVVLISPYIVAIAALFHVSPGYYFGIILFALYGCYYYFPSYKRLNFEKRIFRIKED